MTTTLNPIARRFAWKEYRMLRGFWLAVAGLTVFEQWLSTVLAAPGSNVPAWLLGSALFAAVLYAVGAAATSFAVEHEEETYDFLAGLPTTWPAVFIGKLLVATLSAIALAAVLALSGRAIGGSLWSLAEARQIVGLFGVAILEAVAWGMLFSLLLKRPLVAAVAALLATTAAIHLAVSATVDTAASFQVEPYNEAIVLRLAIVAGVLLLCMLLARNWLTIGERRTSAAKSFAVFKITFPHLALPHASAFAFSREATTPGPPISRLRMLASLLWQTWGESWKLLLVPPLAAAVLFVAIAMILVTIDATRDRSDWLAIAPMIIPAFVLPALYGALVFHADQRRRQYRFLAEHAASPRWVWLARHCVWGGAFVVVLLVVQLLLPMGVTLLRDSQRELRYMIPGDYPLSRARVLLLVSQAFATVLLGGILPYAIGQLCSMFVRSAIITTFLTIVLSLAATSWTLTVWDWRLNGWLFLVPLAVGLMAATWLRAPDWIAERHMWRAWWKPATAIAASFVLTIVVLPIARLAQLPERQAEYEGQADLPPPQPFDAADFNAKEVELVDQLFRALVIRQSWVDKGINEGNLRPRAEEEEYHRLWEGYGELWDQDREKARTLLSEANRRFFAHLKVEARKTAQMYLQAAEQIESELEEIPLVPWFEEFPLLKRAGAFYPNAANIIPRERWDAYRQARDESLKLIGRSNQEAIRELLAASRRPSCRFDFDWSLLQYPAQGIDRYEDYSDNWPGIDQRYVQLTGLALRLPGLAPADAAVESYIAALRMCAHLRERVPTVVTMVQLRLEQAILDSFARWAQQPERTDAELRDAAEQLEAFYRSNPLGKSELFAVDRQLIRDAIEGRLWPLALSETPLDQKVFLAYLANKLPWERERALEALDLIIAQNYVDVGRLLEVADQHQRLESLARWLRPFYRDDWPDFWARDQQAAATSYFMRYEYEARVPIYSLFRQLLDAQTFRNATLLEIALARYHLEHGKYPSHWSELKPDYLRHVPIDPYSGRDFDYRPDGLDLPLHNPLTVPPGTPLFWSVGPNDARLIMQHHSVELPESADDSDDQTSDQPNYRIEAYYSLDRLGRWHIDGPVTVFPLAK